MAQPKTRKESRGRELTRAIAALTSAETPLPELLGEISGALARAFGGSIVFVAAVDGKGSHVEYFYRDKLGAAPPDLIRKPDAATASVLESGHGLLFRSAQEWPEGARLSGTPAVPGPESGMFAPMIFVGKCIGVLSVQSRDAGAYDEQDMALLESCAQLVGARISDERGRSEVSRLERIATTDALTGLANRRAFDTALADEWKRCRRHGLPLSLLLLDVDFFKQYNDKYGHVAGDACLKRVAGAIGAYARRPGDVSARYGGEEFAILLPGTDRLGAVALAEAIRKSVTALAIVHESSSLGFVSVSIGAGALMPNEKGGTEELVRRADALLYEAKSAGRNRTAASGFESASAPAQARHGLPMRAEGNVPLEVSSFVGRELELAHARRLLEDTRLLTLVGTGGVGKTRIALRLAADLAKSFPDGVWFADLTAIQDGDLVPLAVLAAMQEPVPPTDTATDTLVARLEKRAALIVLDNCEHVIAHAAALADTLHHRCSALRIVATSREPLAVDGEVVCRLAPMAEIEAVRLFRARATAVVPTFAASGDDAEAIAQICRKLDGIPLAIELAAARVRMLPVQHLARSLENALGVLTSGSRTAQPRQQTLRGLIAWSYDLLSEAERTLYRRLCVLVGDWPVSAATAIGSCETIASEDVFDLLAHLVDKSLVNAESLRGEARYRILESTRAYGLERAAENGELEALRQRHADVWRAFAEETSSSWESAQWSAARDALRRNYDNLRAALTWSIGERHDVAGGAALAIALELYWSELGPAQEGRHWYELALEYGGDALPAVVRGKLHLGACGMALLQGDYASMRAGATRAVAEFEAAGEREQLARARSDMAIVHFYAGEHAQAKAEYLAVLELWREVGDRFRESVQLANLAEFTASYEMQFAAADEWYGQALAVFDELGMSFQRGILLSDWSETADFKEDRARALDLVRQALDVFESAGSAARTAEALVRQARYFARAGDKAKARTALRGALERLARDRQDDYLARAVDAACELAVTAAAWGTGARLAGFADRWRAEKGIARAPAHQRRHDEVASRISAALGEASFARAFQTGRALTPQQAAALALEV